MEVFPQSNLNWSQAYTLLMQGLPVKRASWKSCVQSVCIEKNSKFFTIKTFFTQSHWQPYHQDFGATDWALVEKKDKSQ